MRLRFSARLVLFAAAIAGLAVGLSSAIVYVRAQAELERSLGAELLAVARSASALVDADLLDLVYRGPDGHVEFVDEFELLRDSLDRLRRANGLPREGNPVYIMRQAPDFLRSGNLEFVVMPDRGPDGEYFVGNLYRARPHQRAALGGRPSASPVYTDAHGSWISAAAPLVDSSGARVGLVQVDRTVDFFLAHARGEALAILWGALASGGLAVLLAFLFARSLVLPLRRMVTAVHDLARGSWERRVDVSRGDELGELARGIDGMATSLESQTSRIEAALREAEAAAREKAELLTNVQSVNRVLQRLSEAETPEQALRDTLESVRESQGWAYGCYWRVNASLGELRLAFESGAVDGEFARANQRAALARGVGLPGRAWDEGSVVFADDGNDTGSGRLTPAARRAGVTSAVAMPVVLLGEVSGVLEFIALEGSTVSLAIEDSLRSIGQFLSAAHERLSLAREKAEASLEGDAMDAAVRGMAEARGEGAPLDAALASLRRSFGWQLAGWWRADGAGGLQHESCEGDRAPALARDPGTPGRDGPLGAVVAGEELAWSSELLPQRCGRARALLQAGLTHQLALGLRVDGRCVGALEFAHDADMGLVPARIEALRHIGRLAAAAVDREVAQRERRLAGERAAQVMAGVARGDLRERMEGHFEAEHRTLQQAVNHSIETLEAMVRGIGTASSELSGGARRVAESNSSLRSHTESQLAALRRCTESVGQLTDAVRENVARSRDAGQLAGEARELALAGGRASQAAVASIERIEETTGRIVRGVAVIDQIADRSSLLSLNASIEAVRAGVRGRGFGVVAREVQGLARETAAAAQEVKALVAECAAVVAEGAAAVRTSGTTLEEIVRGVGASSELMVDIARTGEAEVGCVGDVEELVAELDTVTQRNARLVEALEADGASLASRAGALQEQIAGFRLSAEAGDYEQ